MLRSLSESVGGQRKRRATDDCGGDEHLEHPDRTDRPTLPHLAG
jgi:hypothetical protein